MYRWHHARSNIPPALHPSSLLGSAPHIVPRHGVIANPSRSDVEVHAAFTSINGHREQPVFKIRQFLPDDTADVADIWLEALFLPGFTNMEHLRALKTEHELQEVVKQQLLKAYELKRQASVAQQRQQLERQLQQVEQAILTAPSALAARPLLKQRKQLGQQQARRRRQRMNMCLVAEHAGSRDVVGYASVCITQPEALLPPPFPCSKPFRLYLEGIAVAPEHRRQGIASSLIAACERLGQLWGRSSLWLHVDQRNRGALELYRSLDYRVCASKGLQNKRYLMAKALPALQMQQRTQTDPAIAASDNAALAAGALVPCDSTAGNGSQPAAATKVYLWDADHV